MRSIMILSLVCAVAHAEPAEKLELIPRLPINAGPAYHSALKLQLTGAMFMGTAIVHLFGTTVAGYFAADDISCGHRASCKTWGIGVVGASVTFALGAIFTIIGIPMYIEGTTRLRKLGLKGARFDASSMRLTF